MAATVKRPPWQVQPCDREFLQRELASFIPPRIFDAHCHVWPTGGLRLPDAPESASAHAYRELMRDLLPNSRIEGSLFIPFPTTVPEQIRAANQWVSTQVAQGGPSCRGLFLVGPKDDPEWVRQEVRRLGLHGLKCYHTLADSSSTWDAQIPEYLPERLVQVANDEGWLITLHVVRARGVADPGNAHWIQHYCRSYPRMKLILAHSARGFQPAHNWEALAQLKGQENLYFDSSANCEPMAHLAIIRLIGHQRLLFGSDLPVSHLRGRSVAVADSFLWLYRDTPVWSANHTQIEPVFVGLENLRSLKWACWADRLSDSQIEDIFLNNAARLFGIPNGEADVQPKTVRGSVRVSQEN